MTGACGMRGSLNCRRLHPAWGVCHHLLKLFKHSVSPGVNWLAYVLTFQPDDVVVYWFSSIASGCMCQVCMFSLFLHRFPLLTEMFFWVKWNCVSILPITSDCRALCPVWCTNILSLVSISHCPELSGCGITENLYRASSIEDYPERLLELPVFWPIYTCGCMLVIQVPNMQVPVVAV